MQLLLIAIMLVGFVSQQFSCCGEHCSACADAEITGYEHEHDGDDHEHEHESPSSSHGPHHLCVATHLFYVGQAPNVPVTPDLSIWQATIFPQQTGLGEYRSVTNAVLSSMSLPPPTAHRLRAALQVWVI